MAALFACAHQWQAAPAAEVLIPCIAGAIGVTIVLVRENLAVLRALHERSICSRLFRTMLSKGKCEVRCLCIPSALVGRHQVSHQMHLCAGHRQALP